MKIENIKKSVFSKFASALTILAMVLLVTPLNFADAASYTAISDIMSREKATTLSNHKISFVSTTAMVASGTITIAFSTYTGTPVLADVQICHGATTGLEHGTATVTGGPSCTVDETVAASNGASTIWGASWASQTLTLTAPSGTWTNLISAGHKVVVFIRSSTLTNPAASSPVVTITGSNGDVGNFSTPIVDDDQVTVTATVNSSITFDIDTATSDSNTNPAYTVALGTLTSGTVKGSDHTTVNSIFFDIASNAPSGTAINVSSLNAGLKSTSTPADIISSTGGTMTAGTSQYGACVNSISGLTDVSPFNNATCTATPAGNVVGSLTVAPQNIFTTTGPVSAGRGEMFIDAAISGSVVAHSDYGDTLTFTASGTF